MVDACPILHVDDDAEIRLIVEMALQLDPIFRVEGAGSAREALALVGENERSPPHAVVLDYQMPDANGIELMRAMRSLPTLEETPFIFLTARVAGKDIAGMLEAGAQGVLAKPFNPITLAADLRVLLRLD